MMEECQMGKRIRGAKNIGMNKVKFAFLLLFVGIIGTGCGGGGGSDGQMLAGVESGETPGQAIGEGAAVSQSSLKMELCAEVNGWDTGCRFLGLQFAELNQEEVEPLTGKYGRREEESGRRGRDN